MYDKMCTTGNAGENMNKTQNGCLFYFKITNLYFLLVST